MRIRHPFEVLSDRGVERVLSGKHTLNLVGHNHAWYVVEGRADIFVVDIDGGQDPFVSIEKGNLIFPFGKEIDTDKDAYFRASGIPGTKLVELPIPVIDGLATDAVGRLHLVELVNQWLEKASRGVIRHVQPRPRIDRQISVPAEDAVLAQGARVSAAHEPCWISGSAEKLLFVGMEVFSRPDCIIPLTQHAWIEAIGTAQIKVQSTEALLLSGDLWSSLANWHNVLLACEQLNGRLAAVDEYNRLILQQERDEQKRHMAFSDLRAVVDGRALDTDVIIDRDQDRPLLAIVSRVAQACHVKIRIPAQRPPDKDNAPDTLDALLDPSSTRSRIVRLPAGWERKELGPLIGWTKDGGLPVALIPISGPRYQAYFPGETNPQIVDMSLSENLRDDAVMLYRSFGHERIRGRNLVSFGLKGARHDMLTIFGGIIATGLLGWLFPYALGTVLNTAIPLRDTSLLLTLVVALIVSVGAIAASQIAQGVALLRIESRFDSATGAAVMDRLLKLSPTFLRKFASGDLGLRALALSTMRQQISAMLVNAVLPSISGLLSLGLIWILSPTLAIYSSFLVFILLVVMTFMARRHLNFQHRVHAAQGQLASLLLDIIANIAKLRVASGEGMAFARWAKLFSVQQHNVLQSRKIFARLCVVLSLLPAVALLVILYGTTDNNVSSLGPGRLIAMQIAWIQIISALMILCPTILTLVGTLPQYERMAVLLHAQPEVKPQSRAPGELSGGVEMSHVSFRYDANGPLVLDDVNMRVEPGEFVAIVGASGSGKSTVFRLLLGFENPERGTVTFDGEDLAQLDVTAVRKQMGVVLQHSRLMPGTIFNNIVGAKQLSMEEAWQAARLARVDDDIRAMPMGMHSMTGDGAAALSGGQRQRILIARALASRPRILLFDEATSALDNLTQAEVMQSLEDLPITRILIAHRLSTIKKANRIFVLQDGRIAQHGRFEEMLSTPGPFQDIVTRQKI